MSDEPATTVLVTHDVREALRLGSYLVVMERGQVVQHGAPDDVVESPVNGEVAKLFADQLSARGVGRTGS